MRRPFATLLIAASLTAGSASLRSQPPSAIAIIGGTLIDGNGSHPLQNSVVIVEGDRIRAVGQVGSLAIPAGAEVIS